LEVAGDARIHAWSGAFLLVYREIEKDFSDPLASQMKTNEIPPEQIEALKEIASEMAGVFLESILSAAQAIKPEASSVTFEMHPRYIRLPKAGTVCPHSGLSRSGLCQIILPTQANKHTPPVRSFSLKSNKYSVRGIRLINYQSLVDYLEEMESNSEQDNLDS